MSVQESRGGYPHVFLETVDNTSGREHGLPFVTKYLQIRVTGNPCKLYFRKSDFDNDEKYVTVPVPSAETPNGEWSGPVEGDRVWLLGVGGNSSVELVAYQRRG